MRATFIIDKKELFVIRWSTMSLVAVIWMRSSELLTLCNFLKSMARSARQGGIKVTQVWLILLRELHHKVVQFGHLLKETIPSPFLPVNMFSIPKILPKLFFYCR